MTFEDWWAKRPQGVMSDKEFCRFAFEAGRNSVLGQNLEDAHALTQLEKEYERGDE